MHNVINHYKAARAELEAPGSPFETTTIEVRGVPVRVFKSAPPNMRVLWEATAAHGDKEYVVYEDEHYSYAQIHEQVRKLAAAFVAQGVQPGDRIALAMRNYPEWITGYWAGIAVGAAVVGMNAWWTPSEMEYALNDSQPKVLVVDGERLERLMQVVDGVRSRLPHPMHVISVRTDGPLPSNGQRWDDVMAQADPGSLPAVTIDPDDAKDYDDAISLKLLNPTHGARPRNQNSEVSDEEVDRHGDRAAVVRHLMLWHLVTEALARWLG